MIKKIQLLSLIKWEAAFTFIKTGFKEGEEERKKKERTSAACCCCAQDVKLLHSIILEPYTSEWCTKRCRCGHFLQFQSKTTQLHFAIHVLQGFREVYV